MNDDDRLRDALDHRARTAGAPRDAWSAIDEGREQRKDTIRRRQVVVAVVAMIAVLGVTAGVLALRDNGGNEQVVTTTPPDPAPTELAPSETAVVAATADGRLVGFDLHTPGEQVVLWEAPDDQQIAEVAVDQTRGDIYLTLLGPGQANSSDCVAPEIVRLIGDPDGYTSEPGAQGHDPAIIDGRVAFFPFKDDCIVDFGEKPWPGLSLFDEVGVIEPGIDWSIEIPNDLDTAAPVPDLAWSPDGQLALQTGGSLRFVDIDSSMDALPPSVPTPQYTAPVFRNGTLFLATTRDGTDGQWLSEWTQGSGVAPYVLANPSVAPLRGWARTLDASSTGQYVLWTSTPGEMPRGGYGPEDYRLSWLDRTTSLVTELAGAFVDATFAYPTYDPEDDPSAETTTSTTACIQKGSEPPDTPESDPAGAPLRVELGGAVGEPGGLVPYTLAETPAPDESMFSSPHFGLERLTADGWQAAYTLTDVDTDDPDYQPTGGVTTDRGTEATSGAMLLPPDLEPGWYRLTTRVVVTNPLGVTLRTYNVYTLLEVPRC